MTENSPLPFETATCRFCGESLALRAIEYGRTEYVSTATVRGAHYVNICDQHVNGNHVPRPEVGMPLTWSIGSDRYVALIAAVSASLKTVTVGNGRKFTLRSDGSYRAVGGNFSFASINVVAPYRDPSF